MVAHREEGTDAFNCISATAEPAYAQANRSRILITSNTAALSYLLPVQ